MESSEQPIRSKDTGDQFESGPPEEVTPGKLDMYRPAIVAMSHLLHPNRDLPLTPEDLPPGESIPRTISERFEEALWYAAGLHRNQVRKGADTPYISHLLGTAAIALEYGATEDEAIAALLHDAVEDQGGVATLDEIRHRFGDAVAEIVQGCTDSDSIPKPPWKERKQAYLEHLRHASPSVRLVSAADKLHNGQAILADYRLLGESLWKRFAGGKEGTLWYYRSLVEAFASTGSTPLVKELDRVVSELEQLAGASKIESQ